MQDHVQQEQQRESTLQTLVKKVEKLGGTTKKRQNMTQMKGGRSQLPAMIVAYLDILHFAAAKTLTVCIIDVNRSDCLRAAECTEAQTDLFNRTKGDQKQNQ